MAVTAPCDREIVHAKSNAIPAGLSQIYFLQQFKQHFDPCFPDNQQLTPIKKGLECCEM